jgi:nucleotidyltransferase substrate binding protein (TIGR01987 family)
LKKGLFQQNLNSRWRLYLIDKRNLKDYKNTIRELCKKFSRNHTIMNEINLDLLDKALKSLEQIIKKEKDEIIRDATIQRFEYTFEISWKTLKRYFKLNNNINIHNLKDIFREAGKHSLIDSVENWFSYLESRNLTSHTYNLEIAEEVYKSAKNFSYDARKMLSKLEKILG